MTHSLNPNAEPQFVNFTEVMMRYGAAGQGRAEAAFALQVGGTQAALANGEKLDPHEGEWACQRCIAAHQGEKRVLGMMLM